MPILPQRLCITVQAFVLAGGVWECGNSVAQQTAGPTVLDPIVVTGRKITADEAMTQQVAVALLANPYVLDDHIDITTQNGVVTLRGVALDNWDVQVMLRMVRRMPGVRKVINDIDVELTGD